MGVILVNVGFGLYFEAGDWRVGFAASQSNPKKHIPWDFGLMSDPNSKGIYTALIDAARISYAAFEAKVLADSNGATWWGDLSAGDRQACFNAAATAKKRWVPNA